MTGPSQSRPSQRSDSWICSVGLGDLAARVRVLDPQQELAALVPREEPVEERRADAADVEEARSGSEPCGRGRSPSLYRRAAVEFGAHMSSGGGIDTAIDRIEAIGGDCVQVFTQSPRMWRPTNHKPEAIERFQARRAEAGIGGVVCHALYLCNLAAPNDEIYEKSIQTMRSTVDAATAIDADGVIFHVGSHLGAGFERRPRAHRARRSSRSSSAATGDTWLLMENSAGAGGTIGRSLEELQTLLERLDRHPRLGICLDSCHLYASGYDVTDPRSGRRRSSAEVDAGSGSTGCARCT